jgi:dihydroorotate dehydrogenase
VGTANFVDPRSALKIISGLEEYCRDAGVPAIREIIGSLNPIEEGGFVYY